MYESFFGLDRRPFAATPNPDCFAETRTAQVALAALDRSIRDGGGIAVLTAPAGLGKTLLLRRLATTLPDEFRAAFLPSANFTTRRALLQSLLYELGRPYAKRPDQELRLELSETLHRLGAEGRSAVLLLDEAHLLSKAMLEEVRLLTQLQEGPQPLVSVVLAGQLALEETLAEPGMEAVNQRLVQQCYLESLTREESADYIAHRVRWAGGDPAACFDDETLRFLVEVADGVPRALHQIGDHTLLLAFADERRPSNLNTAREAYEDVRQLPLHWNAPHVVDAPVERPTAEARGEANDASWASPHSSTGLSNRSTESFDDATSDGPDDVTSDRDQAFETSLGEGAVAFEFGADDDAATPDLGASTHELREEGTLADDAAVEEWDDATIETAVESEPTVVEFGWSPENPGTEGESVSPVAAGVGEPKTSTESGPIVDDAPCPDVEGYYELALAPQESPHDSSPVDGSHDDERFGDVVLAHGRLHRRESVPTEVHRPMPPRTLEQIASPALAAFDTSVVWSEETAVVDRAPTRPRRALSSMRHAGSRVDSNTSPAMTEPATDDSSAVEGTAMLAPTSSLFGVELCQDWVETTEYPAGEALRNLPLLESALAPLVGLFDAHRTSHAGLAEGIETVPAATVEPAPITFAFATHDATACEATPSAVAEEWEHDVVEIEEAIERQVADLAAETARAVKRARAASEGHRLEPPSVDHSTFERPEADTAYVPEWESYDVVEPEDFGTPESFHADTPTDEPTAGSPARPVPPPVASPLANPERPYARLFSEIRGQWTGNHG